MLRSGLVYLSKASWAQKFVSGWGPARRTARRFVAGESVDEAIQVVMRLNQRGILGSLDQLGENTTTSAEATQSTQDILTALDAIQANQVKANVSIKLTQIGLALDPGLCKQNLLKVLAYAKAYTNFVRIDMEDSPFTQATIDLFCSARQSGFDNVGIVLQSYLYRTEEDLRNLDSMTPRIRLVKGAYLEPAAVAYPKKVDVDASFDRLASAMIHMVHASGAPLVSADGRIPPLAAFATHDPKRIAFAKEEARKLELPLEALEFQMLYGIRRDLQDELVRLGYPVRVYIPYGSQWYPYLMRRLAERPTNLWFFANNFFRK